MASRFPTDKLAVLSCSPNTESVNKAIQEFKRDNEKLVTDGVRHYTRLIPDQLMAVYPDPKESGKFLHYFKLTSEIDII